MPLAGAPLLEYQLSYLKSAGITEVCFATNYMAEAVESYFGDGSGMGMKIKYAVENEPLDTAGAIRNGYDAIPGEDCVVFNGDVIHNFDIADIVAKHIERDSFVTLTLKEMERPHAFGVVPVDDAGNVIGFLEPTDEQKQSADGPPTGEFDAINAGLYVMKKEALEALPQRRCNIEREIFPNFIASGKNVYGDVRKDFWIDIGKPSQYLTAISAIVAGDVASPRPFLRKEEASVDPSADVADDVRLCCGSSVDGDAVIEPGAKICNSAILEGARIGSEASIIHSIVGEGAVIGGGCEIRDCAIAPGSVIGESSRLGLVK
jgi:mannose-1-phosphate guanylyltransferase